MQFQHNISLRHLNTFGIEAFARHYVEIHTLNDLSELFNTDVYQQSAHLILGGGSNILLLENFDGLVIKNCISAVETVREDDHHGWVKVGAGILWHDFVLDCINENRGGVENLSLIPGTSGAAPMQNIGAYGVEIKDVFECLIAFDKITGELHRFDNVECEFGYRESIFKREAKNQYIITSITLKLSRHNHRLNISHSTLADTLKADGVTSPTIKDVSNAVIKIRERKLPDPKKTGNAGSFFKNPVIDKADYQTLQREFPIMVGYQLPDQQVKVPAGWLIEQCGWKGKTIGNVGVHENQALVLVNHGNGSGVEIKQLAMEIKQSVMDKFGIELAFEVNFVASSRLV